MHNQIFGKTQWATGEGYIPKESTGQSREMTSHEALCFLNTGEKDAEVRLWIYFTDKDPQGPYEFAVPARRSYHLRINDLKDPAPVPKGTEYSCYLEASHPVVVQHTRLDSRQAANAIMTTMAYGE